jgi:hypothetical protein
LSWAREGESCPGLLNFSAIIFAKKCTFSVNNRFSIIIEPFEERLDGAKDSLNACAVWAILFGETIPGEIVML